MRSFYYCFFSAFTITLLIMNVSAADSLSSSNASYADSAKASLLLSEIEHDTVYFPFRDEKVTSILSYGFYRDKARLDLQEDNGVLTINYGLPQCFDWGNWLGVRRKFKNITDLSITGGIQFDLKVDSASNAAKLRITLCDIGEVKRFSPYSRDYMWWCDFNEETLREARDWITVRVSFSDFYRARGGGTRPSPFANINPARITAYEFNIITSESARGQIQIRNIKTWSK